MHGSCSIARSSTPCAYPSRARVPTVTRIVSVPGHVTALGRQHTSVQIPKRRRHQARAPRRVVRPRRQKSQRAPKTTRLPPKLHRTHNLLSSCSSWRPRVRSNRRGATTWRARVRHTRMAALAAKRAAASVACRAAPKIRPERPARACDGRPPTDATQRRWLRDARNLRCRTWLQRLGHSDQSSCTA